MKNKHLVQGALLLALTIMLQSLRLFIPLPPFISNFIIGSIVNSILIVAVFTIGIKYTVIIAFVAPLIAFAQGLLPIIHFIPLIMVANISYFIAIKILMQKNKIIAIATAALIKVTMLYFGKTLILTIVILPPNIAKMLSLLLSWPQIITAVLGGILGILMLKRIKALPNT